MATELNRVVTELIIDARGSVAGAAQAVRASKEAELATNKLSDAEERAYIARKKQEGAYIGVSTSLAKVRAEYTNLQAKMDPVFAAQTRHQKELERAVLVTDAAVRRGVTTEQQAAATIAGLRQQQIRDLQAVKDATQDVIRVQRAANSNVPGMNTANIAAQIQDIGVTSAMGMSPLQIALQQGTQIQAVLGPMGAAGAVKTLGAAFLSLINPVSLVTIALVAGTAALIQYFSTGEDEAEKLDGVLKQHADSIRALKDAYGEAAEGAREYLGETASMAKALTLIAQLNLGDTFRDQVDALVEGGRIFQGQTSQVKADIERVEQAMVGKFGEEYARLNQEREKLLDQLATAGTDGLAATKQFEPFKDEIADLIATIQAGSPDIIAFREAIGARINADPTNRALATLANELLQLIDGAYKTQSALGASETALDEIRVGADATASSIGGLTAAVGAFNSALQTMTGIAAPALSESEQAAQALNKALAAAGSDFVLRQKALDVYADTMERIRNKIAGEAVPIPTPRPNDIEMWDEAGDAIDKAAAKVEQAKSRAAGLIEKFFPGEAARREAHELIAMLEQFGGQLDDMQRKVVEMRVDELFVAASLGLRDLGNETDKTSDKFGRLKDKGKEAADALKDGFGKLLEDLFTGKDLLESILSLGSRLASMNFDNFAEGFSNWMGGKGFTLNTQAAKASAQVMGKEIGAVVAPVIRDVANDNRPGIGLAGSVGSYTSAISAGKAMGQAVVPVLEKGIDSGLQTYAAAIRKIESGSYAGNYGALGPVVASGRYAGDRAYGAYQVMGGNIASWTKEVLGTSMSIKQFLGDKSAQDAVFFAKFGQAVNKFGNVSDAVSVWFTGRPANAQTLSRSDGYNTNAQYISKFNSAMQGLPDAVRTGATQGTEKGAQEGTFDAWAGLREVTSKSQGGPAGGFGMQGAMGLLGAGLGGFSTGYESGNAGMGALGGALQGFGAGAAIGLPVIGAVVGAIGGLIGGLLGARNKVKKARRELEKQMAAINALLDVGFGRGMGNLQKQIADFNAEADKAVPLAWKAKRMDLVDEIHASQRAFFTRLSKQFYDSFDETFAAYGAGLGLDSPIMKGAKAMGDLREELRNFIADTRYFGEIARDNPLNETNKQWWLENHGQEVWENEVRRQQELFDRTMAQATSASIKMILAMVGGAEEFTEYESAVMAVKGAIDVAQSALEELGVEAKMAAAALDKQLNAALKKLQSAYIDDVSRSLYDLADVGYMGDLLDAQKRYNDRLRDAAALGLSADLANRELALSLRNIVREAKLTDDQIRQLAEAMPELSASLMGLIGAGEGVDTAQALADAQAKVEEAKAALRSAYEKERSEIESTISRLKSFTEGIKGFKDSLRLDKQLSPLSPYERLMEAQRQFNEVSAKALGGDEGAQGRLEEVSRAYLEEARAYYASSEAYFQIFEQVEATLDQALAKAEGQLSNAEKQLSALERSVKGLIDIDDGVKSVGDAIKDLKAAQAEEASAQAADDAYKNSVFAEMLAVLKAQLAAQNAAAAAQLAAQNAAKATYSADDPIAKMYRQYLNREPDAAGYAFFSGNLNSGKASLADIEAAIKKEATGMATGGWVTGGIPGMDSVLRMLMPGEFVMPAQTAQRYRPEIEAMRGGWYGAANDNSQLIAALREELRSVRAEIERLVRVEAMSGRENVQATRETAQAVRDQARDHEFRSRNKQKAA